MENHKLDVSLNKTLKRTKILSLNSVLENLFKRIIKIVSTILEDSLELRWVQRYVLDSRTSPCHCRQPDLRPSLYSFVVPWPIKTISTEKRSNEGEIYLGVLHISTHIRYKGSFAISILKFTVLLTKLSKLSYLYYLQFSRVFSTRTSYQQI